jgi:uncharacterized protein
MAQTWRDLLFAHWKLPAAALARVVPKPFDLDLWNGDAYIGVIPFRMARVYLRGTFPLPWLSATPEINVRTYVTHRSRPGVYFLSLHASHPVAVKIAHGFFHLPYFQAAMSVRNQGEAIHYASRRDGAEFRACYRPAGEAARAQPGTLDYWLTERYCYYSLDKAGRVVHGEVDHRPWSLQPAEASIDANTMTAPFGIDLPGGPALLHFSESIDVRMWMPERA